MGTFITQPTTPDLYLSKVAAPGAVIPTGLTAANVVQATDMNTIEASLLDCRTAIRGREFNVRHYGATGNGTTDDRAAIAACLAAANNWTATNGSATVFFPSGTYLINDGAQLVLETGVTARGDGASSVLKRGAAASYAALLTNSDFSANTAGNRNIAILDLAFDSNGPAQSPAFNQGKHAVAFVGVRNGLIANCFFTNPSGDSIYLTSTLVSPSSNFCQDIRIAQCHFDHESGGNGGRNGVSVIDAEGVVITGNTFLGCASTANPGAIDLEPNLSSQRVVSVSISGNTFRKCRQAVQAFNNVSSTNCRGLNVVGNMIDGSREGGHGIFMATWEDVAVTGNTVKNITTSGSNGFSMLFSAVRYLVVSGNAMFSGPSLGISLAGCSNSVIAGNHIANFGSSLISLDNADNVAVTGNTGNGWAGGGTSAAVKGTNGSDNVTVAGNCFNAESSGTRVGVRTDGACTGWRVAGNHFPTMSAANFFVMVNTNRVQHDWGSALGATPSVTGSRGGNAALASLLTTLATLGLITDGTSA